MTTSTASTCEGCGTTERAVQHSTQLDVTWCERCYGEYANRLMVRQDGAGATNAEVAIAGEPNRRLLDQLIAGLREFLHLPDAGHVLFALGIATGAELDGDSAWGQIIGPPAMSKTEAIRITDRRADERVDDLTPASLLSWTPGRNPRPTGILARAGGRCFATISDFSTVLSRTERFGEHGLYALLRRAHDGRVQRDLGNAKGPLVWEGRLTLLAASTPKIDDFCTHADALGPRWIYLRMPNESANDRAQVMRKAREHPDLDELRRPIQDLAARLIDEAAKAARDLELPEAVAIAVDEAANVCVLGRATISRNPYGRREIIGLPVIEGPARVVKQLSLLARGVLGLGLTHEETAALVCRVALDSIPEARRRVLEALSNGTVISTAQTARTSGATRTVAYRALEELAAIGIAEDVAESDEDEEASRGHRSAWRLIGPDAETIARVVSREVTRDSPSPHHSPPQYKGEYGGTTSISGHSAGESV